MSTKVEAKSINTSSSQTVPSLSLPYTFNSSIKFMDVVVHYHAMITTESIFVWIGDGKANLTQLSSAIQWKEPTDNSRNAVSTTLISDGELDDAATSLSERIVAKLGIPAFVSYSTRILDTTTRMLMEKALVQALAEHVEEVKFLEKSAKDAQIE